MKYRALGKTGVKVSEISLGTWQLGGSWGAEFDKKMALNTLRKAREHGINCFDTADVYQGNMSELTIGEFIKREDKFTVCHHENRPQTRPSYRKELHRRKLATLRR